MNKLLVVTLVVDNPRSWIWPYMREAQKRLKKKYQVKLTHQHRAVPKGGDAAFFISCEKIITSDILKRSRHNLVIHESALPKGRGMSPLTWQIIEGKKSVPVTLFEAEAGIDTGDIYYQALMKFRGDELVDELRAVQGTTTIRLMETFLQNFKKLHPKKQSGKATYYRRRGPKDSELNVHKSLAEQFDLLRVVDNDRYPAHFSYRNHEYIIKIYKKPKA